MKSILVTGGTGSFGRAFVRRLLKDTTVDRIAVLSRGEHAQADMRDRFSDDRLRFFVGDVRDRDRLRRAFHGIDVVVHAAALKRIEVGRYNPTEMVQTNIDGTINVVEAALDADVKKVVYLSSDKAWQPISPYGQSKALAESIILNAYQGRTRFAVTRYGNVWCSQGSVVPRWRSIKGPVPVTDPDATRFFMTMDEAVGLVLDTALTMRGGELKIPTLPAFRLGDLAEAMGAKMNVIGLPSWEKKHEGMCEGNTSDKARRMTVDELKEALREDGLHHPGQDGQQAAAGQSPPSAEWTYSHFGGDFTVPKDFGGGPDSLRNLGSTGQRQVGGNRGFMWHPGHSWTRDGRVEPIREGST
jgi:UDP-N-acetylglucosamine 4,6-dehydratase